MTYSEIYALRIRELCKKRKITINKLATLAGLKQSTIDNILRGTSKNPKVRTLHKIANVFGMTLSSLFLFRYFFFIITESIYLFYQFAYSVYNTHIIYCIFICKMIQFIWVLP